MVVTVQKKRKKIQILGFTMTAIKPLKQVNLLNFEGLDYYFSILYSISICLNNCWTFTLLHLFHKFSYFPDFMLIRN